MDRAVPTNVDGLLEHAGWIRLLAGRLVRDAATADDVVQETWLAALRQHPEHGHSLKPWLARVLRNQAALLVRGDRRRRVREESAARHEHLPSAAELAARGEVQRQLVEAVLELRDPYRSVLLLRYYEGLNPEAIAVRLVVPGSTVRTHLARGLVELRENLERRAGGDRRGWCLALVPLAIEPEGSAVGAGSFAAIASSLLAMQVITKFAIAACALALVVALSYFGCDRDPGENQLSAAMPATAPALATGVSEREPAGTGAERAPIAVETPIEAVLATQEPASPTASGRLKIRLRDKNSRLPVANYTLVIDDGQHDPEPLITSADGTCESLRDHAEGELAITLLDCERTQSLNFYDGGLAKAWPSQIEHVQWTPGKDIELEVAIGPTLTVSLSSRSTLRDGDWFGAVYSGPPCEQRAALACERAPLRTGASTWMRCAAQAIQPGWRSNEFTLIVSSADGLMAGSVNTPGYGDVAVDLNPTGRLDLELARNDKRSIDAPQIELRALKGGCVRRADSRWNGSDVIDDAHAHNFTFGALEPGEYEVIASCSDCVPDRKRLRLSAGKITRFTMVLDASTGKSRLRGELRSVSTRFATPVIVRATAMVWPEERALTQRCEFQDEGGALVAHFEFNGLPKRKYRLQVIPTDNEHPRWTPQSLEVAAPNEELVFTCHDDEPRVNVRLRALDADTDDPLDKAKWEYTLDGVELTSSGDELVIESVSTESRFEWNVTARGYGITSGNWKQVFHAGRESFGEARLQRGWGAKVRVVNEWSRVPLADATIVVDREEAGHTDANGVLLVDRRRVPRWIGAKLEGWEQVDDMRKLGVVIDDGVHNVLVLPMREMR